MFTNLYSVLYGTDRDTIHTTFTFLCFFTVLTVVFTAHGVFWFAGVCLALVVLHLAQMLTVAFCMEDDDD